VEQNGQLLSGANAVGDARHPLGRASDVALTFAVADDGRLVSVEPLPAGRWNVQLSVRRGADIYKLSGPLT
jgi:nitrogen fixation protein FixH